MSQIAQNNPVHFVIKRRVCPGVNTIVGCIQLNFLLSLHVVCNFARLILGFFLSLVGPNFRFLVVFVILGV